MNNNYYDFTKINNHLINKNKLKNIISLEQYKYDTLQKLKQANSNWSSVFNYIKNNTPVIKNYQYLIGCYNNKYYLFIYSDHGLSYKIIKDISPVINNNSNIIDILLINSENLPLYINTNFINKDANKLFLYRIKNPVNIPINNSIIKLYWKSNKRYIDLSFIINNINDIISDYIQYTFDNVIDYNSNKQFKLYINNRLYILAFDCRRFKWAHLPEMNTTDVIVPTDISNSFRSILY